MKGENMAKGTVNKVILVGRLGADPDIRYSSNGTAVAKFNLATNENAPVGDGNWEERTEWHRIVAFGKVADRCSSFLNKGKLIYLEGSLRTNQWEDKDGIKRYTTEIVMRDFQMLGGSGPDEQGRQFAQGGQASARRESSPGQSGRSNADSLPPAPDGPDDDIPF